jgi:vanillate/3-O-methylgallate O-demethylase
MTEESFKEQYRRANRYGKPAFIERPYIGSPGAPAQAETNASNIWGHINGGFLIGYEYTRWWKESQALRNTAILGDWSWLNKVLVTGPDAGRFMNFATIKDLSRQQVGQIIYTPMVNEHGKVAIEGLTLRLAENEYIFTQSGGQSWLPAVHRLTSFDVAFEDVTPDYTCYALQGPRSTDILEALAGESCKDLRFSRWRMTRLLGENVIVARQGVTGEIGYEFLMRTDTGKAHELWRTIRRVGQDFGLRELGFKAQLVGHTETGIATVIRDFLPARMSGDGIRKFARLWMSPEELDALNGDLSEHFCSPAELGWSHTINLEGHGFHGRDALLREADAGGPARKLVGLLWDSDDMSELYAALFRDTPSAPPPDLPCGQFRMLYLKVLQGDEHVGWASGVTYSPNIRRMISLARIRKNLAMPGTAVSVLWGGFSDEPMMTIRARVHALPFIKQHRKDDLRGKG